MYLFALLSNINICKYNYVIDDTPIIENKDFKQNDIICINSSRKYLTVILNTWDDFSATAYHTPSGNPSTEEMEKSGPYTSQTSIAGFDFGETHGYVEITCNKDAPLSFSTISFSNTSLARFVSTKQKDQFILKHSGTETILIKNNQHIEYFNGAPATQHYSGTISTDIDDLLQILNNYSSNSSNSYSGIQSFTYTASISQPIVIKWTTDKDEISGFVKIKITMDDYNPQRYVHFITNDKVFITIPYYEKSKLSTAVIAIIIISCVIALIGIVSVVIVFLLKRKKKLEQALV